MKDRPTSRREATELVGWMMRATGWSRERVLAEGMLLLSLQCDLRTGKLAKGYLPDTPKRKPAA